MTDRVSAEGLREARDPYFEPDFRLRAWAGCVQRLIAVAPIKAVLDETGAGFSGGGHSTPPERKAIRDAAAQVVDGWLARDLAALRDTGPRPDSEVCIFDWRPEGASFGPCPACGSEEPHIRLSTPRTETSDD